LIANTLSITNKEQLQARSNWGLGPPPTQEDFRQFIIGVITQSCSHFGNLLRQRYADAPLFNGGVSPGYAAIR